MPTTATPQRVGEVLYRFRNGESLSGWMSAEELRHAAADGRLQKTSEVQQVGKEAWCPAEKVHGLFDLVAFSGMPERAQPEPVAATSPSATPVPPAAQTGRIAESIHHVLQRALMTKVHVIAPDWDEPHDATLAGVMADGIALEFEEAGTVIYIPWIHVRAVAATSEAAHSVTRIRDRRGITIDVDRIPTAAFFPQ